MLKVKNLVIVMIVLVNYLQILNWIQIWDILNFQLLQNLKININKRNNDIMKNCFLKTLWKMILFKYLLSLNKITKTKIYKFKLCYN